jgi:putative inorganic carbon (HCO3(-)) transporter
MENKYSSLAGIVVANETFALFIFLAASLISERVLPAAVLFSMVVWTLRWKIEGFHFRRSPVDIAIIILVLLLPIALWISKVRGETFTQICRLLLGIALYFSLIKWLRSESTIRNFLFGILFFSIALVVGALFSVQWMPGKFTLIPTSIYSSLSPLINDRVHPNVMAGILLLLVPWSMAPLLFNWRHYKNHWRFVLVSSLAGAVTIIILTQSRGALVGLCSIIILLIALRWRLGWVINLVIILIFMIWVQFYGYENFTEVLSTSGTIESLGARIEIWSRAIYMIWDFPMTGIGMGGFKALVDAYYPLSINPPGSIPHAHNLLLQIAVDLGLIGLVAWLAAFIGITATCWHIYKIGQKSKNAWITTLGAGLLCSQTALFVHGITDAVTWGMVKTAPLIWGLWGMAVAIWNLYGASRSKPAETSY